MYGNRSFVFNAREDDEMAVTWLETNINGGFTLPFNLSSGIYSSNLSVGAYGSYTFIDEKRNEFDDLTLENGNFASAHYFVNYYRKKRLSWKDLDSRFGQSIYLSYKHIPYSNNYDGYRFHASGKLFFPGFLKHHNFMISAAYEQQLDYVNKNNYYFGSNVNFPRGYEFVPLEKISSFSVDYQLPLFYPDFGIMALIYFKRVRMNMFYDVAVGEYRGIGNEFSSTGLEFTVDFNMLRLPIEFNAGFQIGATEKGSFVFPMIMGVVPF